MASYQVQNATNSDNKVAKQTGAHIGLTNQTSAAMTLNRRNIWAGTSNIPPNLQPGLAATFKHTGGATGAKAVAIYYGTNPQHMPCAWVLAWDAPAEPDEEKPNKVFVATGAKNVIDSMTFKQIEALLNQGWPTGDATDPVYRVRAEATITSGVTNPEEADVAATFSTI